MRTIALISVLIAVALCGCDPIATAQVRLQLRSPQQADVGVSVDSAEVREALAIMDAVVKRHGFQLAHGDSNPAERGFKRRYGLLYAPNRPGIACNIEPTATGMKISFSEFGIWTSSAEAKSVATDVRAALIAAYGESRVR
ncbi:MAG: hypothetical protein AB1705_12220 [Verrucomicrobiota bacterium]